MMNTNLALFKEQIREDIKLLQSQWLYAESNLAKDEYAFNYWILSRMYSMDEEIIPDCITEYNDKAIDCFVHYEESKELFIIQNKYYGEETRVSRKEVADFLVTPLSKLRANEYKKSERLQTIYNKAANDSEYKIHFHFYTANENKSDDIESLIKDFNSEAHSEECFINAEYFDLPAIYEQYYGKNYHENISFDYPLGTINKGTFASLKEEYGIEQMYEAYYIVTPVCEIYRMIQKAEEKGYSIFEKNIREYLGKGSKVNTGIVKTLQSETERKNFMYYNNGVTVICEKIGTSYIDQGGGVRRIPLHNPQIVNGCQTVSSIKEVLQNHVGDIRKDFKDVYIMVKALVISEIDKPENKKFSEKVVKFTNSQNAISEKAFTSNMDQFYKLQDEFRKRGFLLIVKPSDTNKFKSLSKIERADIVASANEKVEYLGYKISTYTDAQVSLEKLLQVFIALMETGYIAFTKKNLVLAQESEWFKKYSSNIQDYITIDNMIRLYYFYRRAEKEKNDPNNDGDKRMPIPYYLIGFLGTLINAKENNNINESLNSVFANAEIWEKSYDYLVKICKQYRKNYEKDHKTDGGDYNNMIKRPIDDACLKYSIETVDEFIDMSVIKTWRTMSY